MSIVPQLEQALFEAATRRLQGPPARPGERTRRRAPRVRVVALAGSALLATATIALAANGVILTGSPVRPAARENPNVGVGVPKPGAIQLLPLQVADPDGGLPWGMRIVSTTRGEVCLQVGRLQGGQLGELGVDGAFHNDGRFHPLSASVLLPTAASCQLAGKAVAAEQVGLPRSAAPLRSRRPARNELRDVDFGLLGPTAVSVTYRNGSQETTIPVLGGSGAYLVVRRMAAGEPAGTGGASLGSYGDLPAGGDLSAITYRIGGKVCQRGPVQPPGSKGHLANPCAVPSWPTSRLPLRNLHRPLHVHIQLHHGLITGLEVSFAAPFAIRDARHHYTVTVPMELCDMRGVGIGYTGTSLDRNVRRGETVRFSLADPFSDQCGHRATTSVQVLYEGAEGAGSVLVGSLSIRKPAGARPAPAPHRYRRRGLFGRWVRRRGAHRP